MLMTVACFHAIALTPEPLQLVLVLLQLIAGLFLFVNPLDALYVPLYPFVLLKYYLMSFSGLFL